MKKSFIIISLWIAAVVSSDAQVTFAPAGAGWHNLFLQNNLSPVWSTFNEHILYARDSSIAGDTVKVLRHSRFFNWANPNETKITLIKQTGDTIWMRNFRTDHQWQILYNFAAAVNDSWHVHIKGMHNSSHTYTVTVTDTKDTVVKGHTLKNFKVRIDNNPYLNIDVTERLGANHFLFYFRGFEVTDGDMHMERLCYSDDEFGLLKYSELPCEFENPTGLSSAAESSIRIYPNPVSGQLTIQGLNGASSVRIFDQLGRELVHREVPGNGVDFQLDVQDLNSGMYTLMATSSDGTLLISTLIRE